MTPAIFAAPQTAKRELRALLLVVLAPLPWIALLAAESARRVLAQEPVWVRDVATGQLMALAIAIALVGSAVAWRWRTTKERRLTHVVVGSHALFLSSLAFY